MKLPFLLPLSFLSIFTLSQAFQYIGDNIQLLPPNVPGSCDRYRGWVNIFVDDAFTMARKGRQWIEMIMDKSSIPNDLQHRMVLRAAANLFSTKLEQDRRTGQIRIPSDSNGYLQKIHEKFLKAEQGLTGYPTTLICGDEGFDFAVKLTKKTYERLIRTPPFGLRWGDKLVKAQFDSSDRARDYQGAYYYPEQAQIIPWRNIPPTARGYYVGACAASRLTIINTPSQSRRPIVLFCGGFWRRDAVALRDALEDAVCDNEGTPIDHYRLGGNFLLRSILQITSNAMMFKYTDRSTVPYTLEYYRDWRGAVQMSRDRPRDTYQSAENLRLFALVASLSGVQQGVILGFGDGKLTKQPDPEAVAPPYRPYRR